MIGRLIDLARWIAIGLLALVLGPILLLSWAAGLTDALIRVFGDALADLQLNLLERACGGRRYG